MSSEKSDLVHVLVDLLPFLEGWARFIDDWFVWIVRGLEAFQTNIFVLIQEVM